MSLAETIGRTRIAQVVDHFYARIRIHSTLAEPFAQVADWPLHQERLTHFWWVALGGERYQEFTYHVAAQHFRHGFTPALLTDWLLLFEQTLHASLPAEQAHAWLALAQRMGQGLTAANQHLHTRQQEDPHAPHDFAYPGARPAKRQADPDPGPGPRLAHPTR